MKPLKRIMLIFKTLSHWQAIHTLVQHLLTEASSYLLSQSHGDNAFRHVDIIKTRAEAQTGKHNGEERRFK